MKIDECVMEKFGTLDSSEKTIAILGDRWWSHTAKQGGDEITKHIYVTYGKNVMSPKCWRCLLLGVGTAHRLDGIRGQWSND